MRIVVLVKPVPDPASAGERLGPDGRLDRAADPGHRQRQRRVRPRGGAQAHRGRRRGRDHAPVDGPGERARDPPQGARDGRPPRQSTSPTPRSAARARCRPRRSSRRRFGKLEFDMVFAGIDASDGVGGIVPAAIAAHLGPAVPVVRGADRTRHGEPDRPRPPDQPDRLRPARGAAAGRHRRHAGARRAALPVAEGDHGGARQGDRDPVAGRPRHRSARRSAGPWRRPRSSTRGCRRPAPPPRSSAARPTRVPPASSSSSPSGGSSDGRAVGRRRTGTRRRRWRGSAPRRPRSSAISPRAPGMDAVGIVVGPDPAAGRGGTRDLPAGRLGRHRSGRSRPRLVRRRRRPHRGTPRRRDAGRGVRRGGRRRPRPRRRRLGADRARRARQRDRGDLDRRRAGGRDEHLRREAHHHVRLHGRPRDRHGPAQRHDRRAGRGHGSRRAADDDA